MLLLFAGAGRQTSMTGALGTAVCDLDVTGMDCAACAATIERSLRALDGVAEIQVNVLRGRVRIGYAPQSVRREDLVAAINRAGYGVTEKQPATVDGRSVHPEGVPAPESFWRRRGRLTMSVIAGVAVAAGLVADRASASNWIVTGLLAISTLCGGWYVIPQGLRAARQLALDMNFLMSIAAIGAWVIGERAEAAATLFLFAIAELLESVSMDRARNAIKALMDLTPPEARLVRNGVEEVVHATAISPNDVVRVRPGEKIPVDGVVLVGRSTVNQAPITGESMPVEKVNDSEVFAGTLNGEGALEIRATRDATDTTLARIVHAVEEAQASRAPTQAFVDRFARIYTPLVVAMALGLAIAPPLFFGAAWNTWIYRALAMLVVACPCALVISTPVAIVSGLAGAARAGVLIKGGIHLENACRITAMAFDKTGTLTSGSPRVLDVTGFGSATSDDVLRDALSVERDSEHPLARAITLHGQQLGITAPPATEFRARVGSGAEAVVGGIAVAVGNERLASERGVSTDVATATLQAAEAGGETAVLVFRDNQVRGVITIADRVRDDAKRALAELRALGVHRLLMLTGDNAGTARAIAGPLGLSEVHAGLLPDDKVRIIRELEASGERVAFVGDGVNDAPALAASTVGIAMGAAGTDVALETADIALMADDLGKLAATIRLARRTRRIIRQNVWFSIGIKAVFLVLAVTGNATLWMAVAADMGASLIVVANGLRARRVA